MHSEDVAHSVPSYCVPFDAARALGLMPLSSGPGGKLRVILEARSHIWQEGPRGHECSSFRGLPDARGHVTISRFSGSGRGSWRAMSISRSFV